MAAPADAAPESGSQASKEEDRSRRRLGWAGLGVAAACFLSGLMSATIFGATYAAATGLDQAEANEDLGFVLVTSAGLWVGFLLLPILWALRQDGPARYLGLSARWVDVPLGLVVGLASVVVTAVVSTALLSTGEQDALEDKARDIVDRAQGPVAAILLILALCVATPLAEEVFFRGLLFRSLERAAPAAIALVVGGLIFGPVHYDGESVSGTVLLVQLGMLSLFGLALCALVHRTGRLGAAVVAHAVFNAVTVVSLLAER